MAGAWNHYDGRPVPYRSVLWTVARNHPVAGIALTASWATFAASRVKGYGRRPRQGGSGPNAGLRAGVAGAADKLAAMRQLGEDISNVILRLKKGLIARVPFEGWCVTANRPLDNIQGVASSQSCQSGGRDSPGLSGVFGAVGRV